MSARSHTSSKVKGSYVGQKPCGFHVASMWLPCGFHVSESVFRHGNQKSNRIAHKRRGAISIRRLATELHQLLAYVEPQGPFGLSIQSSANPRSHANFRKNVPEGFKSRFDGLER